MISSRGTHENFRDSAAERTIWGDGVAEHDVAPVARRATSPWEDGGAVTRRAPRLPALLARAVRLVAEAAPVSFALSVALQLAGALAAVGMILGARSVIHRLLAVANGAPARSALPAVLLITAVTAFTSAAGPMHAQQQRLLSEQVGSSVWRRLAQSTCRVPLEHFEDPAFHDRLQRVTQNSVSRPAAVSNAVVGLLGAVVGVLAVSAAMVLVEPLLIPILLAAGAPALVMARLASRSEFAFATEHSQLHLQRAYLRFLLINRNAAKEIRAFGTAEVLRARHDAADGRYRQALRRQVMRRHVYSVIVVVASAAVMALTMYLVVELIGQGEIQLAEAGAVLIGVRLLAGRLERVCDTIGSMVEARPFLLDLDTFLHQAEAAARPALPGVGPAPHREAVRLEDVHYTYPAAERPSLRGVTMEVRAGEVVALVGENGSGKTTLAKLIAGLYTPQSGTITWDGRDVADLPPGAVGRAVSVIFQDFVHYQLSAAQNIALGEPDSDDEEGVREAATRAGADEFIAGLPEGYDTLLSNEFLGGVELSGGQWQRIALARALHRRADLVVLDEPSAALDPRAEAELFADVRRLLAGRTVVLITHRFANVRHADRIYVLHEGRVVESGDHDTLLAAGGRYAELFTLQASAYR
jgi:ATP-binding cassette subfamily B protein